MEFLVWKKKTLAATEQEGSMYRHQQDGSFSKKQDIVVSLPRVMMEKTFGGTGEVKELLRRTPKFLVYVTSIWWVVLIMRKRSPKEGHVLGENHEFSLDIMSSTFTW